MSTTRNGGYEKVPGWERLPAGMIHRDVPDVAVDSADRVYVLTRMDARVIVYDRDGTFLGEWGAGLLSDRPHGITIGPDDVVYIVDEPRHSVQVFSTEGRLLRNLGPGESPSNTGVDPSISDFFDRMGSIVRGAGPYNRPTKVAVAPNGELYVTDGYGNARVHRFSSEGELLSSWGEPGSGPGQFRLPHSVVVAPDGRVLVCDRENDRIQLFSPDGRFLAEWPDFHRPAGLCLRDGRVYVAELPWRPGYRSWRNGLIEGSHPGRVTVLDLDGNQLARFGGPDPSAEDGFSAPHGICVDSRGDLYVAEVTWTDGGRSGLFPSDCHSLLKLARAG